MLRKFVAAFLLALSVFRPVSAVKAAEPEFKDAVKLAVFNTPDADFITYVYGDALKRAGYNVDFVRTDYAAHFTALEFGDINVAPAVWTSVKELLEAALKSGQVEQLGSTGVKIRETWWYPNYVGDLCPGLPDWRALKDPACVKALSTPESDGKINYIGTPADWTAHDEERIAALGLQVTITPPGTLAAMVAAMQGAMQRKRPVIGWGFVPHWLYGSDQGKFVEFPLYNERCMTDPSWGVNPNAIGDCELARGDVVKLVNIDFAKRAPYAASILRRLTLDAPSVGNGVSRQERDGWTAEKAASEWLNAHTAEWGDWLK